MNPTASSWVVSSNPMSSSSTTATTRKKSGPQDYPLPSSPEKQLPPQQSVPPNTVYPHPMVLTTDPNKFPPNTELMCHQSWDFDIVPPQETTADPNTEVIYDQTRETGT